MEREAVAEAEGHAAVLLGGTTEAVPSLTNERVGLADSLVGEGFWTLRTLTGAFAYG